LQQAINDFQAEATALNDGALEPEMDLAAKLLENMK